MLGTIIATTTSTFASSGIVGTCVCTANGNASKVKLTGLAFGTFVFVLTVALHANAAGIVTDLARSGTIIIRVASDE